MSDRAKAMRLRERGLTYSEIGKRLGIGTTTAYRWCNPERVEAYKNGRVIDPEKARAYDRARSDRLRLTCEECGHTFGPGSVRADGTPTYEYVQCPGCVENRRQQFVAWWAEGLTRKQIAERIGWTLNHVSVEIAKMRAQGYDIPYRYAGLTNPRHPEMVR